MLAESGIYKNSEGGGGAGGFLSDFAVMRLKKICVILLQIGCIMSTWWSFSLLIYCRKFLNGSECCPAQKSKKCISLRNEFQFKIAFELLTLETLSL